MYRNQQLVELLDATLVFTGLPRKHLAELVRASEVRRFLPSSVMWCEDDLLEGLDLILAGSARYVRLQRSLRRVKKGEFIGFRGVFAALPSSADIITGTDGADVLRLPAANCLALAARYPEVSCRVIACISDNYRDCSVHCQRHRLSVDLQVLVLLRRQADENGDTAYNAGAIATELGITVRQVRDAMNALERGGKLTRCIRTQTAQVYKSKPCKRVAGKPIPIVEPEDDKHPWKHT